MQRGYGPNRRYTGELTISILCSINFWVAHIEELEYVWSRMNWVMEDWHSWDTSNNKEQGDLIIKKKILRESEQHQTLDHLSKEMSCFRIQGEPGGDRFLFTHKKNFNDQEYLILKSWESTLVAHLLGGSSSTRTTTSFVSSLLLMPLFILVKSPRSRRKYLSVFHLLTQCFLNYGFQPIN